MLRAHTAWRLALADAHHDVREDLRRLRRPPRGERRRVRCVASRPPRSLGLCQGLGRRARRGRPPRAAGARRFALNASGDIVCAGEPVPGGGWRVGVRHPDDPATLVLVLAVRDGFVATSGLYERGAHVAHALTGEVPGAWRSITVVAPDLATADANATAALAMGGGGPAWAAARPGKLGRRDRCRGTPVHEPGARGRPRRLTRAGRPASPRLAPRPSQHDVPGLSPRPGARSAPRAR